MKKKRRPILSPPQYDIDELLDVDRAAPTAAHEITFKLYDILEEAPTSPITEFYRPDSSLLEPEVTFLDYMHFNISMGNGFGCSIEDWGLQTFYRGIRSLRAMKHAHALKLAESVRDVLVAEGIAELTEFPDDRYYGWCENWDIKSFEKIPDLSPRLFRRFKEIDKEWWSIWGGRNDSISADDPPLDYAVTEYLNANRAILRLRKSKA